MSQFRTYSAKAAELSSDWHVVDATGRTLGRLASEVAVLIRGKHKPSYSPHQDGGDYVVVVNAEKIRVSGNKLTDKMYYRHSQYPGGLKSVQLDKMLKTHPTRVVEHAVRGMLPDNRLGETIIKKLKVYAGPKHPHDRNIAGAVKAKENAALAAAVEK